VSALKLTVYFGERDRAGRALLTDALLELFARRDLRASVLLRGTSGFGVKHHLRTDRVLTLSEDLPVVAVAIDEADRIAALAPEVTELVGDGLVTLERARFDAPAEGEEAKLTLYLPRGGTARHRAVVEILRRHGAAGATVLAAVDGTLHGERRRPRLFGRNGGVPVVVVSVGAVAAARAALAEMGDVLATWERVRIGKRDGVALAPPPDPAEAGQLWCKLTLFAGSGTGLAEHALHRLRAAGAAGMTVLHGVWGYHGDHSPHGDRARALVRHVPVQAVVVDAPDRAARWFAVLDELTAEGGLVTSELVPAWRARGPGVARGDLELLPPPG
jgi:PII-like signaling protein